MRPTQISLLRVKALRAGLVSFALSSYLTCPTDGRTDAAVSAQHNDRSGHNYQAVRVNTAIPIGDV